VSVAPATTGAHASDAASAAPATLVLHGRGITPGVAEGEALVTHQTISGWGGMHALTGTIIESRHELRGQSVAGRILIFPGAKGSSGWSATFHLARLAGAAPRAMVFNFMTPKVALGAVVMRIPAVTELDADPLTRIATGDWVRVDGTRGEVSVWKGGQPAGAAATP
jgi:predicted aconitase with swiveling domain